jgi:hypothetical protein
LDKSYLVGDNWYACKANLRFFAKRGLPIGTRLRKNGWRTLAEEQIQLKHLANLESISRCHYYSDMRAYIKSVLVEYPQVGQVRVDVAKNDRYTEPGRTKFLITTESQLSNRQLVTRYRHRWVVELFFRDCKQHFGFADCQGRESYQMMFHYRMVFLASSLVTW